MDPLRQRAESMVATSRSMLPHADAQKLIQELEIHQIELELQNEELRKTRLKAEANLERYTELYDFAPVGYLTLSPEGLIREANLTVATLLGIERGKLVGQCLGRLVADLPAFNSFLEKVFRSPVKESCEVMVSGTGTARRTVRIDATVAESGQVCRAILADISEQKRAEELRLESEAQFRAVFQASSVGMCHADPSTGRMLRVNRHFCEMTGYAEEELLNRPFSEITHPDDRTENLAGYSRLVRGEVPEYRGEKRYVCKDGSVIWVDVTANLIHNLQLKPLRTIAVIQDITERKQAEVALRTSEQRLFGLVNSAMDAIVAVNEDQRIVLFNPAAEQMFGLAREAAIGQPLERLIPPSSRQAHTIHVHTFGRTGVTSRNLAGLGPLQGLRNNGETFPVEASISQIDLPSGKLFTVILRDVTRRVQVEQELREADARKDEFFALLAHELRNPMAVTATAAFLLQRQGLTDPKICRWATSTIVHQTELLKHLVTDLLDAQRISRGKISLIKTRFDLGQLIARVANEREVLIAGHKQHLTLSLPSSPVWIEGDAARLTQVISNLLDNASKFTPDKGRLELSFKREGDDAVIRVRDTGRGIPPQLLPHVFEIFTQGSVSLARDEGGLGIGLALVKGLVELHGGRVTAASKGPNRGAEFTVRLPALGDMQAGAPDLRAATEVVTHTRRILVGEDNVMAAEALRHVLQAAGHSVRVFRDGAQALSAAMQDLPEIAIIDIGLPGLDGYGLARRLRTLPNASQLLLIALTGYGQEKDRMQSKQAGFDHHLVKPADLTQLLEIINAKRTGEQR
jgi:PAS domain S-box-containing protein